MLGLPGPGTDRRHACLPLAPWHDRSSVMPVWHCGACSREPTPAGARVARADLCSCADKESESHKMLQTTRRCLAVTCAAVLTPGVGIAAPQAMPKAFAAPVESPAADASNITATAAGASITVRGRVPSGVSAPAGVDIVWDDLPVGRTPLSQDGSFAGTLPLQTTVAGGWHTVEARVPGSLDPIVKSRMTVAAPIGTKVVSATVKPASAPAGSRVTVAARLVDDQDRPVANHQVNVSAITAAGYAEDGWTSTDGTVVIRCEIPVGLGAQTVRATLDFSGDEIYRASSTSVQVVVVAGGAPAMSPSALPKATPAASFAPAPGPTVITPPSPTPAAARPAPHRSRWALPTNLVIAEALLGFVGLVVGLAAGARATSPRRRDDEELDRLIG